MTEELLNILKKKINKITIGSVFPNSEIHNNPQFNFLQIVSNLHYLKEIGFLDENEKGMIVKQHIPEDLTSNEFLKVLILTKKASSFSWFIPIEDRIKMVRSDSIIIGEQEEMTEVLEEKNN